MTSAEWQQACFPDEHDKDPMSLAVNEKQDLTMRGAVRAADKLQKQSSRQAHLAPKTRTTSALARANERAAMTERGWSSGTTPRPMEVLSTGTCTLSASWRIRESAWAWAAPLPTTISGLQLTQAEMPSGHYAQPHLAFYINYHTAAS